MLLAGAYLVLGAMLGPETGLLQPIGVALPFGERLVAAGVGVGAMLSGWGILKRPRSR